MKKSTIRIIAVCLLYVLLYGGMLYLYRGEAISTSVKQEASVFYGKSSGYGGTLRVRVETQGDTLVSISVTEHNETAGVGQLAVDAIPKRMVESQSIAVESISGCTVSSNAIISAVEDALGEQKELFQSPPDQTEAEDAQRQQYTADVIVVGAGGAGLTAAYMAAQQGAKVLIVEKMPFVGGATGIAGGWTTGGGSDYQASLGYEDNVELIFQDLLKNGHYTNDAVLTWMFANEMGPTFDWLVDELGIQFPPYADVLPENSVPRCFDMVGGAPAYIAKMMERLEETDAELLTETKAYELLTADGCVTGVRASCADGSVIELFAGAVLLATGGYGANRDMLGEQLLSIPYYGPQCATGDGHRMAQEVGVRMQHMEYGKLYPDGIEVSPGIAKTTIMSSYAVMDSSGAILVDRNGKRVVNETESDEILCSAMLAAEDHCLYLVMDQETFSKWKAAANRLYAAEIEKWLEQNGEVPPIFVGSATLRGAAQAAGIDPDGLVQTVGRFNAAVDAGADEEFGRPLTAKIGEGPYYIVEQKLRFATTLGGACATERLEALGEKIIPGLYVAGEMVGGVHGDNTYGGCALSWAIVSGRGAGVNAAQYALKQAGPQQAPEQAAQG